MKFKTLSLAALALMGAIMTGCSSSDDTIADTYVNGGKKVMIK